MLALEIQVLSLRGELKKFVYSTFNANYLGNQADLLVVGTSVLRSSQEATLEWEGALVNS